MAVKGTFRKSVDRIQCTLFDALMNKRGQTLVEYALLLVLIAVVLVVMLSSLGVTVTNTYSRINSSLPT